jgi:branched-chain amino acid transport system substrate-binding protein
MTCPECDQVNEKLGIDIDSFFNDLDQFNDLKPTDKRIICASLLGKTREEIEEITHCKIKDRLSSFIYLRIAKLMSVEQSKIAGNWIVILNWLLDPSRDYRLNPSTQLNADNFQASFGRQVFLYTYDREIGTAQIRGARRYQSNSFYQAQQCFLFAWNNGKNIFNSGSPEISIYINNCAIELNAAELAKRNIAVYTIAVVVPIYHDRGQIAAETLQGIAQIQFQINAQVPELSINELELTSQVPSPLSIQKFALKILIVNDINNLHNGNDRTAENLVKLSSSLNLIAVIGHYSSEATSRALPVYAEAGIVLVNSSSTSTKLSSVDIGKQLCFFRIPPMDSINAANLISFLSISANFPHLPKQKKVAIIYAKNSTYSKSYLAAVQEELQARKKDFKLLSTFGYISEDHLRSSDYMSEISSAEVDVVILIIDARIEPNFLANTGLLSKLNLDHCVLAGSATLYRQRFSQAIGQPQIISCLPWHWHSAVNGHQSDNNLANNFCALAANLWGSEKVTWRSATAYDSVLLIARMLQQFPDITNASMLLQRMDEYLKNKSHQMAGVTGKILFQKNGDREHPPAEIVKLCWNEDIRDWQWECISPNPTDTCRNITDGCRIH